MMFFLNVGCVGASMFSSLEGSTRRGAHLRSVHFALGEHLCSDQCRLGQEGCPLLKQRVSDFDLLIHKLIDKSLPDAL